MLLFETITIAKFTLPTLYLVLLLGFIFWLFILWYEAKKDGFDTEHFFDLVSLSVICGFGAYLAARSFYNYLEIYYPTNILLNPSKIFILIFTPYWAALFPIVFVASFRKWSIYRILDIYSLAFGFLLIFLSIGGYAIYGTFAYLVVTVLTLTFYFGVLRFRGYKFVSGLIFSLFLFFQILLLTTFLRYPGYLLFSSVLFIISVANLYYRRKRHMQHNRSLPTSFINLIKSKLQKKDKELNQEQQILKTEDPYSAENRDTGNSEYIDEAILEDQAKIEVDARLSIIAAMRLQVRKALAALKIGKYGICEVCGKPIDPARLRVYPEATTCLEHADKASA